MANRFGPYLFLALLGLVFFARLILHPTQVLYSDYSDLLVEVLPAKHFLVHAWRETGEVPLWCPYSYAGMPFVDDVKAGVFYPPHVVFFFLSEEWVAAALSWLVLAHVIVAGWSMYAYSRWQGLAIAGALTAASGYMFAGKWLLHVLAGGHYFLAPLAWMPLALLWLEQAIRLGCQGRRGAALLRATWAGAVFGTMLLGGHPQGTFYAGVFIGLWSLGTALEEAGYLDGNQKRSSRRTVAALAYWLGLGAWMVLAAVAFSAVELLPAIEAAGQATRGMGVQAHEGFAAFVWLLTVLFGPSWGGANWEGRGGIGVLWVAAAALAPLLCRGRVRFQALVCVLLFAFALGGGAAFQALPSFNLFLLHSRMLLPATLPVALLAGTTTQILFTQSEAVTVARRRGRLLLLAVVALAVALALASASIDYGSYVMGHAASPEPPKPFLAWLGDQDRRAFVYWALLAAMVPAVYWLLGNPGAGKKQWLWSGLLLAELWAHGWPLVDVRPEAVLTEPSECVSFLADHEGRVLDRGLPQQPTATPLGTALPMVLHIEPVRGYNSIDVRRYREYLQLIADDSRPLRPREGPFGFPVIADFPIVNKPLLDLLGVHYLLQSSDQPAPGKSWSEVYTDKRPEAYTIIAGGRKPLPSFTVYENRNALPRAFVVREAVPLPLDREEAAKALKSTEFHRQVFIEGLEERSPPAAKTGSWDVAIKAHQPNRTTIQVEGQEPGWLVLADVWYPGWTCTVDGRPERVYRANYLFRAVRVPAGGHEVVFVFAPASYRLGKLVSIAALAAVGGLTLVIGAWSWLRFSRPERSPPVP